jgi:F-type H+-transporting ATPase subunit a
MVIIEVLSTLIRPLTLAVRLAANIIAGHLLFALLRGCASPNNGLENLIYILVLIPLGVLELTVALIQAFVFSLLSRLYVQETQSTLLMAKTSVTVEVRAIV